MNKATIGALVVGIGAGLFAGFGISRASERTTTPPEEFAAATPTLSTNAVSTAVKERALLLMAIEELDLTSAELEDAKARVLRMERKANRYDWLRDNGLHGDHSMSFDNDTFTPRQKLLDFLGLDAEEAAKMKRISNAANQAQRAWESENAKCVTDNATNCVYELAPVPDSMKQYFIAELGGLLHPEDLQLISDSIDNVYRESEQRREVSATYIPAEEYAKSMRGRGMGSASMDNMLEISINRFDENGNNHGSKAYIFGLRDSSNHNPFYERWSHLFDMEAFTQ